VPELESRPRIKKIWKSIESRILPHLKYCITVNDSIAKLYLEEYKIPFTVIRNVPFPDDMIYPDKNKLREQLGLPQDKPIYILQGAGINIQRGAEEAVEAMQHVPGILLIVGNGDVIPKLKEYVKKSGLDRKVIFIPRQSQKQLRMYTRCADAGLSLDKDTNINYRFSLPNKLFDYIQAGIPVIASPLPEVKKIVEDYEVGMLINSHEPGHMADIFIKTLTSDNAGKWAVNLKNAASELNWGNEKEKLLKIISSIP
jgi:glycosyltransferase involved in cell wall biosynthesis